jgi:hypothetical protein
MNKIILQPCSNKFAKQHFHDTIENPVLVDKVEKLIENDLDHSTRSGFKYEKINENGLYRRGESQEELKSKRRKKVLRSIYPDGKAYIWGVTEGKKSANHKKWLTIQSGDVCLFSKDKHIFASAVVCYKMKSRALSEEFWGTDEDGNPWEYLYFLDEIKQHKIPYEDFNRAIGYKPNYVIQGFNVLDDEKSKRIFTAFNLTSSIYMPDISREKFIKTSEELGSLDKETKTLSRTEQAYLKKHLFGDKNFLNCAICDRQFTRDILVCAHIKPRAKATNKERIDTTIVAPMCRFGCDQLFELGYIVVKEGKVYKNTTKRVTLVMNNYMDSIQDNECNYYKNSKKYFDWHYNENI